ncbi:hypothetical protein VNI00_000252 [Paramarasmius palmivorus]|uniref:Fatty acid desaturase domain-containing protein n=1 Tax=Paramarasmius palmivorus TaxID=297713 RepID=A0AAW0EDV2_9AGAR
MPWYQVFRDGPEYERRRAKGVFTPPNVSIKDLHAAIPKHLFVKSTPKSLYYIIRHLLVTYLFYYLASNIDLIASKASQWLASESLELSTTVKATLIPILWVQYWAWQGFAFAGIWCLGHDAGHDALFPYPLANAGTGMLLHSFVLTPFYSWRATHRTHHKATNSLERDETYIPPTRKDFRLPDGKVAVQMDYASVLEETPAFTLFKLFVRQFFGFQLYLFHNRKGNPKYPPFTSHYLPSSLLFKPSERRSIIVSNIGIACMLSLLGIYIQCNGWNAVLKFYFMPWLFQHNWMVMFTYLQHSDPTIPYYRRKEWTFARGALATVDRPLFGWVGRALLYGVSNSSDSTLEDCQKLNFAQISTDHLAHHFFSGIPFYNLPQVTEAIKPVLGDYYNYDSTGVLYALWRSFTQCVFVEDEGDVLFFKNRYGGAVLELRNEGSTGCVE